jgi:hypothetical protein
VELSPANRRHRRAAIALPDEVDRIVSFHNLVPELVLQHLTEGEDVHPPTVARRIEDAIVADGCVYKPWALSPIVDVRHRPLLLDGQQAMDEAQLCTTNCGSLYFADWIQSDIALELLAEQRGIAPLSISTQTFSHEPGYRAHFRLALPPRPQSVVHVSSLWTVDDNGMTEDRLARYHVLRERVRSPSPEGPRRVFIDRGDWGAPRGLINRREVVEALSGRGFDVIQPERMTVDEIRIALSSASICVGVEGSALAHPTMLMPPGGCIVALVPANRFLTAMKWFTDAFEMRYGYVVGEPAGANISNMTIDVQRLHATLDLVERAL